MTSSFAAIGYGREEQTRPFNETDWTDPHGADVLPYAKSKTLAEHAAWDFIGREGRRLELSVINPVGVFGPVPGPDYATSILIVQRMMGRSDAGCTVDLFRCRGCARRCGLAHPRHDKSRRQGPTLSGRGRRFCVHAGHCQDAEEPHGRLCQKTAHAAIA
jgi:hypothetical protein